LISFDTVLGSPFFAHNLGNCFCSQAKWSFPSVMINYTVRAHSPERLWRLSELPVAVVCAGSEHDRVLLLV